MLTLIYVISMEFLSLSRRRSSSRNVPSGEERGDTAAFVGYDDENNNVKNNWFYEQNNCSARASSFLVQFEYDAKPRNATSYGGHGHTNKLFLLYLTMDKALKN